MVDLKIIIIFSYLIRDNDYTYVSKRKGDEKEYDKTREKNIKEGFAKLGINVEFVGEYVEGPYKEGIK